MGIFNLKKPPVKTDPEKAKLASEIVDNYAKGMGKSSASTCADAKKALQTLDVTTLSRLKVMLAKNAERLSGKEDAKLSVLGAIPSLVEEYGDDLHQYRDIINTIEQKPDIYVGAQGRMRLNCRLYSSQ